MINKERKRFSFKLSMYVFDENEFCLKELHILLKTLGRMRPQFKSSEEC